MTTEREGSAAPRRSLGDLEGVGHDLLRNRWPSVSTTDDEPDRGDPGDLGDLGNRPWALLGAAACRVERDPTDALVAELVATAELAFDAADDDVGRAAAALVTARQASRRARYPEAGAAWRSALDLGGDAVDALPLLGNLSMEHYLRGDLQRAISASEEAYGRAAELDRPADAARSLVFASLYALGLGDLRRTEHLVALAERVFADVDPDVPRYEQPVLPITRGQLAGLRGDVESARACFATARQMTSEVGAEWLGRILWARMVETMALLGARPDAVELRAELDELPDLPDDGVEAMAERARGLAAVVAEDPDTAEAHLRRAVDLPSSIVEQTRARLALGEALVRFGDLGEATEVLQVARAQLDGLGARYWRARCLVVLGRADARHRQRWEVVARAIDDGDVAYRVLFAPPGGVRFDLTGRRAIEVGGRPISFATRNAELAVYALAVAGPEGLDTGQVARSLWPNADETRLGPRVRTMLWHIRTALGPEAWRLERDGDRLVLDLSGAVVDGDGDGSLLEAWPDVRRLLGELGLATPPGEPDADG